MLGKHNGREGYTYVDCDVDECGSRQTYRIHLIKPKKISCSLLFLLHLGQHFMLNMSVALFVLLRLCLVSPSPYLSKTVLYTSVEDTNTALIC